MSFDRRPSAILKAWSDLSKHVTTDKDKDTRLPVTSASVVTLTSTPFGHFLTSSALMSDKTKFPDPLDIEMTALGRQVTLGDWSAVKDYYAKLPEDEGKAGYRQLLQSLNSSRPEPGVHPQMMQFGEKNKFSADDVLALAGAAPHGLDKETLDLLGGVLRQALSSGTVNEHFVGKLKSQHVAAKKAYVTDREAAQVLLGAGQGVAAGEFLPALEVALADRDYQALHLLARHFLALYQKESKTSHLEKAWQATQATLAAGNATAGEQEDAVKQAVELAPKIREDLGQKWLDQSFTDEPQRGMDILATIGAGVSRGLTSHPREPDLRLKALQLQKTAVAALLKAAPQRADKWRSALTLLAGNWLREAEFSHQHDRSAGLGPGLRRDVYGNFFYMDEDEPMPPYMMMQQQPNMPQPIRVGKLLEARPEPAWLTLIDEGVQPKMATSYAELYLKVNEEALAFPFIEKLAGTHPDKARELVKDFLRVWTRNHDPNGGSRGRFNRYMYLYGWETRAETIPLTRSKQERNLLELASWVERCRALNVGPLDEKLLAKAFTTCHSSAEVYRLDALEKVFGSIGALKPMTLAGMAQQMRENLAGLWREPAVQKDKKTNRKTKDIQAEVLRGYSVASAVLDKGLDKFPEQWALYQAKAALLHDENNYQQELAKTSKFSANRGKAMAAFQKAAQLYAAQVKDLTQEDETTQVFEQWLYASLGACDLKHVNEDRVPDSRQPPLIREAIMTMPKEAVERHLATFANTLFTRLSAVNPAVKYRYLKAGLEIVGDHKMAVEARKVFDYYKDLVTEIKLETAIDGSDVVGHDQPFGVFVNLKHTREIERESGGFGRYLQNQNTSMYYSYNYGRPTADYRDKFQAAATEALKEHFDVLSVTFQTDKVNSRALPEYGWRYTPYAYLLLKPRGPQIDKIPPLRIDLDFLETSGYVVLPIESPALAIDAGAAKAPARPLRKLQISQILDERQADKGKLVLEVKATALGLVPELDHIVALEPARFDVVKMADQGVSVARFDPDSEQNAVVSERSWLVTLKAKADLAEPARVFHFASSKIDGAEMTYQRYQDADLANVGQELALDQNYGQPSRAWLYWLVGLSLASAIIVLFAILFFRRKAPAQKAAWKLPETLTPFTVLGFLKRIDQNNGLDRAQKEELAHSIALVERRYFAVDADGQPDLKKLAEDWLRRAN
jgi:hypothetical protein